MRHTSRPASLPSLPLVGNFKRFAKAFKGRDFIEIGSIPGDFCAYFAKKFSCRVTGLDYGDARLFERTMRNYGIKNAAFIHADFLEFRARKKYGIVASFGFIEHFTDTGGIIARHARLVADRGYLVISAPNFNCLQRAFHSVFDSESLALHNAAAMDREKVECAVSRAGFEICLSEYSAESTLWVEKAKNPLLLPLSAAGYAIAKVFNAFFGRMKSPCLSSYWLIIARKKA